MTTTVNPAPAQGATYPGTQKARSAAAKVRQQAPRLLPTLFDRLRDEAPHAKTEAASDYAVTSSQLRDIVQRDLGLLLNTTNAEERLDRVRYPEAAASTINFGIPALAGGFFSSQRWEAIEKVVRRAVEDYEPRLDPETLKVRPLLKEGAFENYNVLLFEIRALINVKPYPLEITVQSSVDLETNRMVIERSGVTSAR
jgi:type VI secretion system protein ImpF